MGGGIFFSEIIKKVSLSHGLTLATASLVLSKVKHHSLIGNLEVCNQSFDSWWGQRMQWHCRMLLVCRQTTEGPTLLSGGQSSSPQSNPKQHRRGQQPQPQRTATCILQTSSCTTLQTEERRVPPPCLERVHQLAAILSSMRITTPASVPAIPDCRAATCSSYCRPLTADCSD